MESLYQQDNYPHSYMNCIIRTYVNRIPKLISYTLVISFFIFLFVHLYCLTNQLINHDYAIVSDGIGGMKNIRQLYTSEGGLSSGRYLLAAANSLSSKYTLPWFTGILCAIYYALSMCAIVSLLQIKHRLSVFVIALLVASFPTAASTLAFLYTADAYFLSLLFSCFGAYFAHKHKFGWVVGAVLFSASLAIYQSYFCFGAALLVLSLIVTLFKEELSFRQIFKYCIRDIASLLLGLILYKVSLDFFLKYNGVELSNYMGIDHMWYLPVYELGWRINTAFNYSLRFYDIFQFYPKYLHYAYIVMIAASCCLLATQIYRKKIYRTPLRLLVIFLLLLIVPLACSLIWVMSGSVHLLMVYPVVLISVGAIVALDSFEIKNGPWVKKCSQFLICSIILLSVLLQGITNTVVSNKAYLKMDTVFKNTYAFCLKLSARIENTEGYHLGMPVLFLGNVSEESRPIQTPVMHTELESFTGIDSELDTLLPGIIPGFCSMFLGVEITPASPEQSSALLESPQFYELDIYPQPGSIRIIDGIMVVKLGALD